MSAVLDFLYSDESEAVERSENVEFVMNVLVVADQLLMPRLKDVCETSVAAHCKHAFRMFQIKLFSFCFVNSYAKERV